MRRHGLRPSRVLLAVSALALPALTCGGGVAVRLRIDEFTTALDLDELVQGALDEFKASGLFPEETEFLPELWPDNLPDVQYRALLAAPPVAVDLSPEPEIDPDTGEPVQDDTYAAISAAEGAISRIDLNRLVLRVEQNSLTVDLPELRLQIADKKDADEHDRLAWRTIGILPSAPAGFIGDLEFAWEPGGESFLRGQLSEKPSAKDAYDDKEFALRVQGKLELDTTTNRRMPAGKGQFRLIVVATFFIDPAGAINAADQL